MAIGTLNGLRNAADITISSQTLGTAAAFAVSMANSQFACVDTVLYISLPANHGGFKLNWLVPLRLDTGAWPLAKIRDEWQVSEIGFPEPPKIVPCVSVNDPLHTDAAVIVPPGPTARSLRIRGSCLFQAPTSGGPFTVNLQGALAGAGANVTVVANSQVEYGLY